MNRYPYKPLSTANDEIRLIRLLPGAFSDKIEIEIFHTSLGKIMSEPEPRTRQSTSRRLGERIMRSLKLEDGESYEALSYVWGSQDDPVVASIRGKRRELSHLTTITRNLEEALRYLRKEDESRILWIDAVCINQEDLAERGAQVSKMSDIFRHATQVAVWLGPEAKHSDVAVEFVNSIAADLIVPDDEGGRADRYIALPGSNAAKLLTHPNDFKSERRALRDLCQRDWFDRLWIYQEYHLSRAAIGIIGTRTLDMRILFKVLAFLYTSPTGEYRTAGPIGHVRDILRPIRKDRPPTRIILSLKKSLCLDERDRVYGILGLLNSKYRARLFPDYSKSVQEVNKAYILSVLNIASTMELWGSGEEDEITLPSWIPNLTKNLSRLGSDYRASGNSRHEITYESTDDSLRTSAKSVGVISKILFILPKALDTREFLKLIPAPTADSNYTLGGSWLDAFVGALSGGRYREVLNFPWIPSVSELRDRIQSKEEGTSTAQHTSGFSNSKGRALFSTTDGLLGLCPISGKIGDRLYIIPGVDTGILLSCVEGEPNHYRLKGECYVQGMMNAEAFLGQLPTASTEGEWSYQFQYVQGTNRIVFLNGVVTTQDDPRLGPLPAGWKTVYETKADGRYHDTEQGQDGTLRALRFKNAQRGKVTPFDPRMTAASLRARGVDLEDVIIV